MLKNVAWLCLLVSTAAFAQGGPMRPAGAQGPQTLEQRIGHTDPAKAMHQTAVHDGAGAVDFRPLLGANALDTNLIFFHRGVIEPKSGIGEHFHNKCEEMFVILDGEAQFTVDGHTSLLKGPVAVPDLMGHAHGIYNATDTPVQWLNINVGISKIYDAFNLGDSRVGAALDPVPQFVSVHFDRALLKPVEHMGGGTGTVQYRRALPPSVFTTTWSYVDHLLIPPGSSVGPASKPGMSEVYYVMGGTGAAKIGAETAAIRTGDAIPVRLEEAIAITNNGTEPLEFLIVGVARDPAAKDTLMNTPPPRMR